MLKLPAHIKKILYTYRYIFLSLSIIVVLFYINNTYWNPIINREKRGLEEQQRNEEIIVQREEARFQVTDDGAFFIPTANPTTERRQEVRKQAAAERKTNEKTDVEKSEISAQIEEKIVYLYNRLVSLEQQETEEVVYQENKLFIPFYSNKKEQSIQVVYKPDYNLNVLQYRGFYERGGARTAIISYSEKMIFVTRGEFIAETSLTLYSVESSFIIVRDNKTGEDIRINK